MRLLLITLAAIAAPYLYWKFVCCVGRAIHTTNPSDEDSGPLWDSNTHLVCTECAAHIDGPTTGTATPGGLCLDCYLERERSREHMAMARANAARHHHDITVVKT